MALGKMTISSTQQAGLTSGSVANAFFAVQMTTAQTTPADMASIDNGIIDDQQIISWMLATPSAATLQAGIIFTATTTNSAASMTSFSVTTPSTATIASIQPGMWVTGPGLALGTRVLTASGTTITMTQNAIKGITTGTFIITGAPITGNLINGYLTIPNRGTLKVLPTDYIMIDNNGFPYLVPSTSVGTNMPWNFGAG